MMKTVRARFANGVLTPLEPLELDEGAVVELSIEAPPDPEQKAVRPKFRVVPNPSGFVVEDPKKLKEILDELDIEEYLGKERKIRERSQ